MAVELGMFKPVNTTLATTTIVRVAVATARHGISQSCQGSLITVLDTSITAAGKEVVELGKIKSQRE